MLESQQNNDVDTRPRKEQLPGYYRPTAERCSYCLGTGSTGTRRNPAVYGLVYDVIGKVVRIGGLDGPAVALTPTELRIMRVLLLHPGALVTHRNLAIGAFGREWVDSTENWHHVLRVNITRTRGNLAPWLQGGIAEACEVLVNNMGVGYFIPAARDRYGMGWAESLLDLPGPVRYRLAMQLLSKPLGVLRHDA